MSTSRPDEDQAEKAVRPWWRRRRALIPAAVLTLLVLVGVYAMRTPSPVGHWDGAEGHDRFLDAYAKAFDDMPPVAATFDVRTGYGVVRAYRFDGHGDGSPLVLLPGRSSATPVWADNMPGLLEIGDVYTIDLLGEPGMSVQEHPITSDEDQAAWLHQTLAGLPEESFNVVGLSIGGWTATNLALHRPERVRTLTLIDPVHVFDDMPFETIARSIPAAVPWLPKSWRDGFNSYTAGGAPVEDVPVADMIEAGMQHYHLCLPQPGRISEERLGELTTPVMAIIAGESVMHDPDTAVATARRALPAATVHFYEDASHAVNGEHPDRIAGDIAAFLAG